MQTIGIICACKSELKPFLAQLKNQTIKEKATWTFYEGIIGQTRIVAVQCGICKVNAALAAQILIDTFHVDAVINSGTAGGMDPALQILDTVIAEKIAYHDIDDNILTEEHPYMDDPYFRSDSKLLAAAREYSQVYHQTRHKGGSGSTGPRGVCSCAPARQPRIFFGVMVTGEQFIEDESREEINRRFSPLCVDMETAGIAHACYVNQVPFLAVRTITDTAEHKGLAVYSRNSHRAGEMAAQIVMDLLPFCDFEEPERCTIRSEK